MDILASITGFGGNIIYYIIPFLIVLTIVVFFHELGHFLVARWNGVKCDAFSVGFGPEIFGFNDRYDTRWKFCAIPLGGYVKFAGDANAASVPDFDKTNSMTDEEKAGSFLHKTVGQRAAVVAAGPIANFILAILIFAASFMILGKYVSEPLVTGLQEDGAAKAAGFKKGDVVVSIDGAQITSFTDIPPIVAPNPGREMLFVVKRNGVEREIRVTPKQIEREDRFGDTQKIGVVGIISSAEEAKGEIVKSGPIQALGQGVGQTWFIITSTMTYLKDIVTGQHSADQLGGPIRIAKVSGDVATLGLGALLNLAAVLSVSIGLLNLFPIPMLDGGHLVFYAYEAIAGKPMSERAQEIGYRIGLSMVLMLMVFATWNDITQILL